MPTPSPTTTWQLLEEIKQHPIEAKGFNLKILKPQKIIFFVVAGIRSEAVLLKILARSRILGLHVFATQIFFLSEVEVERAWAQV